jgi:hypothetical protein
MSDPEKVTPLFQTEDVEDLQRELDEIQEREWKLHQKIHGCLFDRVQLSALNHLHAESELLRTQFDEELFKALDQLEKWHEEEVGKARKRLSKMLETNSCHSSRYKRRSIPAFRNNRGSST